jgi:hypothetical protein
MSMSAYAAEAGSGAAPAERQPERLIWEVAPRPSCALQRRTVGRAGRAVIKTSSPSVDTAVVPITTELQALQASGLRA